jgi:hypothetical protein
MAATCFLIGARPVSSNPLTLTSFGGPALGNRIKLHIENALSTRGRLTATACGRWVRPADAVDSLDAATCKACRARARAGSALAPGTHTARPVGLVASADVVRDLHLALTAEPPALAPCASAPPTLTPALWSTSCKGAQHGRCRSCLLCDWQSDADRWSFAAPWGQQHGDHAPDGAPRWQSLDAALRALASWEQHGREAIGLRSATGPILDRLQRGESGSSQHDPTRREPQAVAAGFDLVDVERYLLRAADRVAGGVSAVQLVACLLARVAGALDQVDTYSDLAARHGASEQALREGVRSLRVELSADLVEAGLLAAPRTRSGAVTPPSTMHAPECAP